MKKIARHLVLTAFLIHLCSCEDKSVNPPPAKEYGSVDTALKIQSTILGRTMNYAVYLPAGYETSDKKYPVLYLLHGLFGNHTDWIKSGDLKDTADDLIHKKTIPEMIVIMPDGLATFYVDDYQANLKYEQYFINEFMPAVEAAYRIKAEKYGRAIGGLSMGGYGSLFHGIQHSDLFCAIYALSAAVITTGEIPSIHGMVDNLTAEQSALLPGIVLDCGNEDFLINVNVQLDAVMTEKGVGHQFIRRSGAHTWDYWRSGLPNLLQFVGNTCK